MNRIMTNGGDDDDDVRGELVNGNEVQEWETCSGVEGEQVVVQGSELVSQQDEVQELENGGLVVELQFEEEIPTLKTLEQTQ